MAENRTGPHARREPKAPPLRLFFSHCRLLPPREIAKSFSANGMIGRGGGDRTQRRSQPALCQIRELRWSPSLSPPLILQDTEWRNSSLGRTGWPSRIRCTRSSLLWVRSNVPSSYFQRPCSGSLGSPTKRSMPQEVDSICPVPL